MVQTTKKTKGKPIIKKMRNEILNHMISPTISYLCFPRRLITPQILVIYLSSLWHESRLTMFFFYEYTKRGLSSLFQQY
jgi:hypothetical protein